MRGFKKQHVDADIRGKVIRVDPFLKKNKSALISF